MGAPVGAKRCGKGQLSVVTRVFISKIKSGCREATCIKLRIILDVMRKPPDVYSKCLPNHLRMMQVEKNQTYEQRNGETKLYPNNDTASFYLIPDWFLHLLRSVAKMYLFARLISEIESMNKE